MKTMNKDDLSPIQQKNLLQTQEVAQSIFSGKTDVGDFERADSPEIVNQLDISMSVKKSEVCTVKEADKEEKHCEE